MTAGTLIEKLEAKKVTSIDCWGNDAFNSGLDTAIAIIRQHEAEHITTTDYEEVLADHRRLVRKLDIALNGEEGAAIQARLCDLVSQVRALRWTPNTASEAHQKVTEALEQAADFIRNRHNFGRTSRSSRRQQVLAKANEALAGLPALKPEAPVSLKSMKYLLRAELGPKWEEQAKTVFDAAGVPYAD